MEREKRRRMGHKEKEKHKKGLLPEGLLPEVPSVDRQDFRSSRNSWSLGPGINGKQEGRPGVT